MLLMNDVRRRHPLGWPMMILAATVAVVTYVAAVDPNEQGHYPTCPFLYLTGDYCPGCGLLRMIHQAAHGHLATAFGKNPLAFLLVPVLAYLWVRWVVSGVRGRPVTSILFRPWVGWVVTAVVLVFWLVRNLPVGHALAP